MARIAFTPRPARLELRIDSAPALKLKLETDQARHLLFLIEQIRERVVPAITGNDHATDADLVECLAAGLLIAYRDELWSESDRGPQEEKRGKEDV